MLVQKIEELMNHELVFGQKHSKYVEKRLKLIQLKYASENNNLNISFHVGRQKYG
jgi:hypothetical protein